MLVNLIPEFLSCCAAPDPVAAYHDYLDRHRPILASYWHNYVLALDSPHAADIIRDTLRAERADLRRLLDDGGGGAIAEETLRRSRASPEVDCPVGLYLMVGGGGGNAGEPVVGGRG